MRGYKIFGPNYTCRKYKYSLNSPNIYSGKIEPCSSGFHYCLKPIDCLQYYDCTPENTYAEVECNEDNEYFVIGDMVVCEELRIVKALTCDEFRELLTGTITTPLLNCSYVKGVLNGYKKRYLNGKLWMEIPYVNGKIHGTSKEWYSNGQLRSETHYVDDKYHGISKQWHKNGQLQFETHYVDDKRHGTSKEWYDNGQLCSETHYVYDKYESSKQWYENGKMV